MKEFIYVVLAGVAIFFIAGIIAGLPALQGPDEVKTNTLFKEDFRDVGNINTTFRRIKLDSFPVGTTRGNKTVEEIDELEIKNGFMTQKSRTIEFDVEDPKKAYLTFDVYDTNLYGDLIILLNGEKVLSTKMMSGISPEVVMEDLEEGKNKVTIKAESSGIKFWAPNIYKLRNLKLKVNDFGQQQFSKPFQIYDYELRGFSHGKVKFYLESAVRNSELDIRINGENIYYDRPMKRSLPYEVRFYSNETDLRVGENYISIKAGKESEYHLRNADLKLFYYDNPERTTIQRQFTVDQEDYDTLGRDDARGKIKFDSQVFVNDELKIEMENKTFEFFPESGENEMFFNQSAVQKGKNYITLKTQGSLEIQNFKISIEENED